MDYVYMYMFQTSSFVNLVQIKHTDIFVDLKWRISNIKFITRNGSMWALWQ